MTDTLSPCFGTTTDSRKDQKQKHVKSLANCRWPTAKRSGKPYRYTCGTQSQKTLGEKVTVEEVVTEAERQIETEFTDQPLLLQC